VRGGHGVRELDPDFLQAFRFEHAALAQLVRQRAVAQLHDEVGATFCGGAGVVDRDSRAGGWRDFRRCGLRGGPAPVSFVVQRVRPDLEGDLAASGWRWERPGRAVRSRYVAYRRTSPASAGTEQLSPGKRGASPPPPRSPPAGSRCLVHRCPASSEAARVQG
jgi:hypothetical protein